MGVLAHREQASRTESMGGADRAELKASPGGAPAAGRYPCPILARVAELHAVSGTSASRRTRKYSMAALMRLPARQRQVVALRLILYLDTAWTAEILGIAPGTVMAHLGRAMTALRHDLQPELQRENQP